MDGITDQSLRRIDALSKVTGKALYPGDINFPDQVYMKVLFAERPHAIIKSIDISRAEKLGGVLTVITAKDVPVNEYGLSTPDQPVLCGVGSSKVNADRIRFVGDQIALVIAENEVIAAQACRLIKVEFEDLPVVTDPRIAISATKNLLHPDKQSNIIGQYQIKKGNTDEAFKQADVIVEGEYHTPAQEHAYLQPEAGLAYIDDEERITVVVAGQWTHEDQEQIAHSLNLPKDKIRVIYPAIGGAFGGREDMSVQVILALAVYKLSQKGIKRPVKIIWSREESMIGHHKRHPYYIKTKWAANKEGKIIAAQVELIADGGAYAYTSTKVLGNATLLSTGPYDIPNVKVNAYTVYTNNIPNGAFRGFGGPQAAFIAETQVNKLAKALKIDPVELRLKNTLRKGSLLSVNTPVPVGVTISEVVEKCAEVSGWRKDQNSWDQPKFCTNNKSPHLKRGIGFACAYKNIGFSFGAPENCEAKIELYGKVEIEQAILYHAGAEVGQGAHTVFIQMAAKALNISTDKVKLFASDTSTSGNSGSASASRMTFMAGNAIKGAAEQALKKWKNEERPAIAHFVYRPPATTPLNEENGYCSPNFTYGYVAESVEVEVDIETGQIKIIKLVCADDVGKAINKQQIEGQIEGCLVQASGYTLLENFIQQEGKVQTKTLSTYLIPTVLDVPDQVESVILEYNDPLGPWGARGMAEMPYLPLAPAITAAVHDAIGIWFNEFPLTPERIFNQLRIRKEK
jgi:CO/xanthine dehydrogenase Mo-binding subunit